MVTVNKLFRKKGKLPLFRQNEILSSPPDKKKLYSLRQFSHVTSILANHVKSRQSFPAKFYPSREEASGEQSIS